MRHLLILVSVALSVLRPRAARDAGYAAAAMAGSSKYYLNGKSVVPGSTGIIRGPA